MKWRVLVNAIMNLSVPHRWRVAFLNKLSNYKLFRLYTVKLVLCTSMYTLTCIHQSLSCLFTSSNGRRNTSLRIIKHGSIHIFP